MNIYIYEVIETRGNYRAVIRADGYPEEPYDEGASPLFRMDYRGGRWHAEHIMNKGKYDDQPYIEAAAERWGAPSSDTWTLFENYLRISHGVTKVETWDSGNSHWYVTYDSAAWREYTGAPAGSASLSVYRAYAEDDVWVVAIQKRVTWVTEDSEYADRVIWEDTDDVMGGYYGRDYAEQAARENLDAVSVDDRH